MRLITTQPLLQDLMALDPPWDVDGEAKTRSSRPHSARGSLFAVTLNFLLSIVSWTSDGKEGRNRDNLIALKIPNKPEQRLSAPDLSFLVLLQGEALAGATCTAQVPRDSKYFGITFRPLLTGRTSRNLPWLGCGGKMQTPGARASPAFQGDFGALRSRSGHPPLGHSVATTLPSPCPSPGGSGEAEAPKCCWIVEEQGWRQGGHGRRGNEGRVGRGGGESSEGL